MVEFYLNNKKVVAKDDETIWAVAKREGITLPHLVLQIKPDTEPMVIAEHAWSLLREREFWLLLA